MGKKEIKTHPFFSVITVCYNAASCIKETIVSVNIQKCNDYEYLIIDGLSTDGTQEIVETFLENPRIQLYSEKDTGIYNAMNKGIRKASGRYLYFLNAGDTLKDSKVLGDVKKCIEQQKPDVLHGMVKCLFLSKKQFWLSENNFQGAFRFINTFKGKMPCHQGLFVRTDLMRKHPFDEKLKIRADYDFWVYLCLHPVRIHRIDRVIADYLVNGASALTTERRRKRFDRETKSALLKNIRSICHKPRLMYTKH